MTPIKTLALSALVLALAACQTLPANDDVLTDQELAQVVPTPVRKKLPAAPVLPAANDNLNTIGNSRSTPKEKGLKKEAGESVKREDWLKERGGGRKSSQHHHHHHHEGPMASALFNFGDPSGLGGGPFGGGMLHFPPLGEPLGLLGLGMPAAGTY